MATNYAQILGIQNKWAPIVFAVIYGLILLWYLLQAGRKHAWVYVGLAFFSALRVVSFSLRAAMANNHHNDAFNRRMAIAYEVLYNVGYFSLLLSAYRLLNDRGTMAKLNRAQNKGWIPFPQRLMGGFRKSRLMELLLLAAIVLGAVGSAFAFGTDTGRTKVGNALGEASTYIFLGATVIAVLITFLLVNVERSLRGAIASSTPAPSTTQHIVLLLVAALLLLRILFTAATVHQRATGQPTPTSQASSAIKQTTQGNEHFWYPLVALAELLAVLLFLAPGLVPLRSMMMRHRRERASQPNEKANTTGMGYNAGDTAATGGLGAADHAHNGFNAV